MVYTINVALMYQVAANRAHEGRRRRWAGIARLVSVLQLPPRNQPVAEADAQSGGVVWPRGVLLRTGTRRVMYGSLVGHIRISAPNVDMFRLYKSILGDRPVTVEFRPKCEDLVQTNTRGCTNSGPCGDPKPLFP